MTQICEEVSRRIEEEIIQSIRIAAISAQRRCEGQSCNWWCLCCNKWFCWLEVLFYWLIVYVTVVIIKTILELVCTVVTSILEAIATILEGLFMIPGVGGLIRTVWNFLIEVFTRAAKFPEFLLTLAGVDFEKRMQFQVIIPSRNGFDISEVADIAPMVTEAQDIFKRTCNIKLVFLGYCHPIEEPPINPLSMNCNDTSGFFDNWGIVGSWIQLITTFSCNKNTESWRRVFGVGAPISVIIYEDFDEDTAGCGYVFQHHVAVEAPGPNSSVQLSTMAHEIGHVCSLQHVNDSTFRNLMSTGSNRIPPITLNTLQRSLIRTSPFCSIF